MWECAWMWAWVCMDVGMGVHGYGRGCAWMWAWVCIVWLARPSHLFAGALRVGRDGLAAVAMV